MSRAIMRAQARLLWAKISDAPSVWESRVVSAAEGEGVGAGGKKGGARGLVDGWRRWPVGGRGWRGPVERAAEVGRGKAPGGGHGRRLNARAAVAALQVPPKLLRRRRVGERARGEMKKFLLSDISILPLPSLSLLWLDQ